MMRLEDLLRAFPRPFVTDGELEGLLPGTPDSRYSKVKRLIAQGKLHHIRRGLYCLTDRMQFVTKPHPFELAQLIYGPSYISLESALSFHQLIPERVYTVTSTTCKRSKEFKTPLGLFSFLHLPLENFYTEVELVTESNSHFFMAKPWKAICDFIYCYKKDWQGLSPLVESLRIQPESLPELRDEQIELLDEYYHHMRINRFLKSVKKDLLNER